MTAWLLLGALAGFRAQEMAGLRREDVLDDTGMLRVTASKGGDERQVPMHPDVRAALEELPMPAEGFVFRNEDGSKVSPTEVSRRMAYFFEKHEIKCTPHQLRHYFGTHTYRNGLDIRLTQELMGHRRIESTLGYAAADTAKGRSIVESLHVMPAR